MSSERVAPERLAKHVRALAENEDLSELTMLEEICATGRREAEEQIRQKAERKVTAVRMAGG